MQCPKCGSDVYDNRPKKLSGAFKANAPDFKCQKKTCDWVQWPDKSKASPGQAPAPIIQPEASQAYGGASSIEGLFWASVDDVMAGLARRKLTDFFKSEDVVKLIATQFIGRKG